MTDDGDPNFDARCRRAACLFRLARAVGSEDHEVVSTRLAVIECQDRPGLTPGRVLSAADDIVERHRGGDVQAALIAELDRLKAILGPFELPPLPDVGGGSA